VLAALLGALVVSSALVGCRKRAGRDAALATIEEYRRASGAKPLGGAHLVRLRLLPPEGAPPEASGRGEIVWEEGKYRESLSSQGLFTVRGIQSAKAYFTDEDGITRVVSEPVLKELTTRAYFWRRSWLFADLGGARVASGDAREGRAVVLEIRGGNPLTLFFSGDGRRLLEARSDRMRFSYSSPTRYRDASDPERTFEVEISWSGLPTTPLPDATVGGGSARFTASEGAPFVAEPRGVLFDAEIGGRPARVLLDGRASGLLRLSPAFAERLGLSFREDAFARRVAGPVTLTAGGASFGALHVELAPELRGEDAVAGAPLFREAVVELDPASSRLRLHDPETWVPPENLLRIVIDDDQNVPAAILTRGGETLRLLFPTAVEPGLVLAPESASRVGLPGSGLADGLRWGPMRLAPLPFRTARDTFDAGWGEDGALGWQSLLAYRAWVHMPRRWLYLGIKPS
jgi:hypothetical protein